MLRIKKTKIMKRKFKITAATLSILIVILSIWSFTLKKVKIKGKIILDKLPTEVYLQQYDFNQNRFVETATLNVDKNGNFSYDLPGELPQLYQIKAAEHSIEFPADKNSDIKISLDSTSATISGPKQAMAIEYFKQLINEANERHFADLMKLGANREKMQDKEFAKKMMNKYKNERLTAFYAELEQAIDNMEFSIASLYCLSFLDVNKSLPFISKKVTELNGKYSAEIMNSWNKKIENAQKIQVGKIAPWIENVKDINDKSLNIKSLRGRFIIVDFWASWCKPCLVEIPFYAGAYQKYHEKGLEIIGINMDYKKEQCMNMQQAFNIPWHVVFNNNKELAELYLVKQLPQNILIDNTGVIIAKNFSVWEIEELLEKKIK